MGLESWEKAVSLYEERTGEMLADSVKRLTLQVLCPPALQDHLDFHASRLSTYAATKSEVDAYLDAKTSASSGATPMDLDALYKGKSKGKGKKNNQQTPHQSQPPAKSMCRHCQKPLTARHTGFDCWFNPKNKSPEA
eukprot:6463747-Amphidinium_carterae.1